MSNHFRYRLYLLKHALNEMVAAIAKASRSIDDFVKAVDRLKKSQNISPVGGKAKEFIGA